MSSTDNILLNPIPELTKALSENSWGIDPSSEIILPDCFPITPEDIDSVRSEVKEKGGSSRVIGKAKIVTLEGDVMVVVLDQRGFTIENIGVSPSGQNNQTYETLEALLIASSPLYVEAMSREISKRFEGYSGGQDDDATQEEEDAAEGGSKVWQ